MKKGCIVLLLILVLLFSIISVNFVSAGLLGDVWNKITGQVTENETESEPEPEPPVEEPPEEEPPVVDPSCGDGICQDGEVCDKDCCEQFCTLYCPDGAVEGSCGCECIEPEEEPPDKQCEEGEIKYYTCEDGTKIPECECENGGWVCKISVKDDCPDDEPEPKTCAAKIQITFNKNVYNIGDPVKMIIEIFDSQGNHLPNYAFYGQMYDDRWHTADLQKTDDKGYLIHTGTAEKPAGGVTEVKFKVYTKEISSCGSVEDTAEVKLELGECGIGGCVPEPECEDKIRMCGGECPACPEDKDGDGDIFYPCNGCELEGKCYPYGYRKAGDYCLDENDVFVSQLADNANCENNFECKTNLCINGNCLSSNVWNKFLAWFKKMFGGDDEEEPKECSKLLIEKDIGNNEYNQTLYGISEETQAPLFSDDCEQIGKIKCCVAQYLENRNSGMGLVCPYDDRADVENLVRCGVGNEGDILAEYNGEKVIKMDKERVMVWTYENYAVAVGKMPEVGIPEEIADAYLNKYPSDLGEIDIGDVPPPRPPNSVELCGEIEDDSERNDCYIDVAISKSDVEICENIDDIERKDKCYINVAEHIGDDSICDKVNEDDLREKCYFWVAEQTGEEDICVGISDIGLQEMCYVNLAEQTWDAGICENIIEIRIRNKCYREVAISLNDASICELIIDDGLGGLNPKDECYAGTD